MESRKRLFIRADASARMGTGHIMRMIALAQAWQDQGGESVFLSAEITPALKARLQQERFPLHEIRAVPGSRVDLEATCAVFGDDAAESTLVALDGYQFDVDFQLGLKDAGCRLLVMDDYGHCSFYHADWVLNQNISARHDVYARRASYTRLLLGTKYALLRREFLQHHGWQRPIPKRAHKILVTLGGADPDNASRTVIEALAPMDCEIKVVVGGSNPHFAELGSIVGSVQNEPAEISLVVSPGDMPGLMAWADIAIAAGGSTAWELAFMGLPSLFVILAENQMDIAARLEKQGLGVCLGVASQLQNQVVFQQVQDLADDYNRRRVASALGQELVDGKGCIRVVRILNADSGIALNPFTIDDIELLWQWANDPETRKNSFNGADIPWDIHRTWCHAKLNDQNCHLWIASDSSDVMIGCVRFDCSGNEATISLTVAPTARGKGYGTKIISLACKRLFQESQIHLVKAFIKPGNTPSMKVFEGAGFMRQADTECRGQLANYYELRASI